MKQPWFAEMPPEMFRTLEKNLGWHLLITAKTEMKIGLLGTGRLGICFALLLEQAGYEVVVASDERRFIKNLQQGVIDTNEPNVQRLLSRVENITF